MMVEQSDERDALRAQLARHVGVGRRRLGRARRRTSTRAGRESPSGCSTLAQVGAGDRVLELACGPGGLGLAAAERVGAGGEVVLSDVVAGDDGDRRGARRGAGPGQRRRPRALDLERIDEPDASYDVVLCREGLMFALEPGARRARDPRGCCARRAGRGRGLGPARAQPVARARDGRGQRADRGAGAAARDPGPVLARRTPTSCAACSTRRAWPTSRVERVPGAAARRLVRRVVGADVGARRPAGGDARVDARGGRAGHAGARERKPCADYETASGGLDFPGVALIASGRRVARSSGAAVRRCGGRLAPGAPPDRRRPRAPWPCGRRCASPAGAR